jgi:hypothetical protein
MTTASIAPKTLARRFLADRRAARFFRGATRPYGEAAMLGVIDMRVRALVAAFNVDDVIETFASCEGHGRFGRYSRPYISFHAQTPVAAALAQVIDDHALASRPTLNHPWEIVARFNLFGQLVYRLSMEGEGYYHRTSRKGLDADFAMLAVMVGEALERTR